VHPWRCHAPGTGDPRLHQPRTPVANAADKARIGKASADLVAEGVAVSLDAGTTVLQVASPLTRGSGLTILTNSTDIPACLSGAGAERLVVIGGAYHRFNDSQTGALAVEAIRQFNVDKPFLLVSAVGPAFGQIAISHPALSEAQRAMIKIAHEVIGWPSTPSSTAARRRSSRRCRP
jgi:DeoR family transcriptional regulator, repressor of opine catabolism and conjugal transfer